MKRGWWNAGVSIALVVLVVLTIYGAQPPSSAPSAAPRGIQPSVPDRTILSTPHPLGGVLPGTPFQLVAFYVNATAVGLRWINGTGTTLLNNTVWWGNSCAALSHTAGTQTDNYTVTGLTTGVWCFEVQNWNASGGSALSAPNVQRVEPHGTIVAFTIHNPNANYTRIYDQFVDLDSVSYQAFLNANLSNAQWTYTNGTVIPSWIESNDSNASGNTHLWLRILNLTAGQTITIYLNIYSKSTFLWNPNGVNGIYPERYSTCGEFDDGNQTFDFYENFCEVSLNPVLWKESLLAGGSIVTGNGLVINGATAPGYEFLLQQIRAFNGWDGTFPFVWDASMNITITTHAGFNFALAGPTNNPGPTVDDTDACGTYSTPYQCFGTNNVGGISFYGAAAAPCLGAMNIYTYNETIAVANQTCNYVTGTPFTGAQKNTMGTTFGFLVNNASGTEPNLTADWVRERTWLWAQPTMSLLMPPSAPTQLIVWFANASSVGLRWINGTGGTLVNNTVWWGSSCGALTHSAGVQATSYQVEGLTTGAWCFKVQSWNAGGGSLLSGPNVQRVEPGNVGIPFTIYNPNANYTTVYDQFVDLDSADYSSSLTANLSNAEWTYANASVIPSWIESNASSSSSNTHLWLRIANLTAGQTITIYLQIYSTGTFLWNPNGIAGIYPEFDGTCGHFDDGNQSFNFYDNFCGPSLSSWSWKGQELAGGAAYTGSGLSLYGVTGYVYAPFQMVGGGFYNPGFPTVVDFDADLSATIPPALYYKGMVIGVTSLVVTSAPSFPQGSDACGSYIGSAGNAGQGCLSGFSSSSAIYGGPPAFCLGQMNVWTFNESPTAANQTCNYVKGASVLLKQQATTTGAPFYYNGNDSNTVLTSDWVRGRTWLWVQPIVTSGMVPKAPTGLTSTGQTPSTIQLVWTQPPGAVLNDTLYYGTSCGTWLGILSVGIVASYNVMSLMKSTTYLLPSLRMELHRTVNALRTGHRLDDYTRIGWRRYRTTGDLTTRSERHEEHHGVRRPGTWLAIIGVVLILVGALLVALRQFWGVLLIMGGIFILAIAFG